MMRLQGATTDQQEEQSVELIVSCLEDSISEKSLQVQNLKEIFEIPDESIENKKEVIGPDLSSIKQLHIEDQEVE